MDVVIIHYNTPVLTEAAIRSLKKNTKDCRVHVFDNSDRLPFNAEKADVIDNTRGQVVDFSAFLDSFPRKVANRSNWGSAKHCKSIDVCFDLFPDGFILMDSDVLIKKDITPLFDERYAWVGSVHVNTRRFGIDIRRVIPFLCYLNVPLLREYGIRYFNPEKMWFLSDKMPNMYYDTGAWLYEACNQKWLETKRVDIDDYALHMRHGSWREKDEEEWLEANIELWK